MEPSNLSFIQHYFVNTISTLLIEHGFQFLKSKINTLQSSIPRENNPLLKIKDIQHCPFPLIQSQEDCLTVVVNCWDYGCSLKQL